jgi:hypothetical protein
MKLGITYPQVLPSLNCVRRTQGTRLQVQVRGGKNEKKYLYCNEHLRIMDFYRTSNLLNFISHGFHRLRHAVESVLCNWCTLNRILLYVPHKGEAIYSLLCKDDRVQSRPNKLASFPSRFRH